MFWSTVSKAINAFESRFKSIAALMGLGLCWACLGWIFNVSKGTDAIALTGFGQMLGFIVSGLAIARIKSWTHRPLPFLSGSVGLLLLGSTLIFIHPAAGIPYLASIGVLLGGAGYAVLLTMWMELYGGFLMKDILLAFCCSYALNYAIWSLSSNLTISGAFVLHLLCAIFSGTLLVVCYSRRRDRSLPKSPPIPKAAPLPLVLLLTVFSFCYGLADGVTNMGNTTIASKSGMAIACIAVIIGLCAFSKQFGSKTLLVSASISMACGMGFLIIPETPLWAIQIIVSLSIEAQQIAITMISAQLAKQNGSSAGFYYSLLQGVATCASRLPLAIGLFWNLEEQSLALIWMAITPVVIILGIALYRSGFFSDDRWIARTSETDAPTIESFSKQYGLTQRETTIVALMVEGKTYRDMAEELFVAQGTIRAHVGHIYQKAQVHSRWELEQKLHDLEQGE